MHSDGLVRACVRACVSHHICIYNIYYNRSYTLRRGAPGYMIRLLMFWYAHQKLCVRWGGSVSSKFTVSNEVRQGGILSPFLFNVYMEDLSVNLKKCPTGV